MGDSKFDAHRLENDSIHIRFASLGLYNEVCSKNFWYILRWTYRGVIRGKIFLGTPLEGGVTRGGWVFGKGRGGVFEEIR